MHWVTAMFKEIILTGSVVTAVSAIIAFGVSFYKFVRKWDKWIENKDKHDRENYLNILRLVIMSEEMPLSERIAAGDKYIELGGNGAVKHKHQELIKKLPKDKE